MCTLIDNKVIKFKVWKINFGDEFYRYLSVTESMVFKQLVKPAERKVCFHSVLQFCDLLGSN